jgi:hypothetical protein
MSLIPEIFPVPINKTITLSSTTETTLWTPAAGKKWVITDIAITATTTAILTFRQGTGGSVVFNARLTSALGITLDLVTPIMATTADAILTVKTSAITAYVTITGYEV